MERTIACDKIPFLLSSKNLILQNNEQEREKEKLGKVMKDMIL